MNIDGENHADVDIPEHNVSIFGFELFLFSVKLTQF